jgi:hypothetical protein
MFANVLKKVNNSSQKVNEKVSQNVNKSTPLKIDNTMNEFK